MKLSLFSPRQADAPALEPQPLSRIGLEDLILQASSLGTLRIWQHTAGFTNSPADRWDVKILIQRKHLKLEVERTGTTLYEALLHAIESCSSSPPRRGGAGHRRVHRDAAAHPAHARADPQGPWRGTAMTALQRFLNMLVGGFACVGFAVGVIGSLGWWARDDLAAWYANLPVTVAKTVSHCPPERRR